MKYFGVVFLLTCLLVSSCKSKEVLSPEEFEGSQLILSHGGGFAGTFKTYKLLENGQLFKSTNKMGNSALAKSLGSETTEQIFSNYKVLGLDKEKIESYGNLNYSIIYKKDGKEHKLVWEKGQKGTEKLQLFYRNIMNQIKLNNKDSDENSKPGDVQ